MAVEGSLLQDLHLRMVRIRRFEETAGRLMTAGKLPGFLHLYVGQEAVAAGVMAALRIDDQLTSTHRGHGHIVAKGGDLYRMMAELYGRSTGYCGGKGGSMHISEYDLGILGANAIVAGGIPIAVGAAFTNRYLGTDRVSATFFGDGATNNGQFHEAANMAAVLDLPVLFVCENNGYGEFTAKERHMRIGDIAGRADAYGFGAITVDGMDAVAVYEAARDAVAEMRAGGGPFFLEAMTYRYYDHQGVKGMRVPYRSEEEVESWKARDAIVAIEARMIEEGAATREEIDAVVAGVEAELEDAVARAEADPEPGPEALMTDIYTEEGQPA